MPVGDWQVAMGSVSAGPGADWMLIDLDAGGIPDRTTQDSAVPGADGVRFGVDLIGGRTVSVTLAKLGKKTDAATGLDGASEIAAAWLGDSVRTSPGAVTTMTLTRPGRQTLRVYGRPRRAAPTYGTAPFGYTPVVADFSCADHRFYADTETNVTVPIVASAPRGWAWPLSWALHIPGPVSRFSTVATTGGLPTWLTVQFVGPVSGPVFELLGDSGGTVWQVAMPDLRLAAGKSVTVDPRPWARTAVYSDGGNAAGFLSRGSARMGDMLVSPGAWQVKFTGTDTTGTGQCVLRLRDAWAGL
jgi:hypothetical protein